MKTDLTVKLKRPHKKQAGFIGSSAKRKVIRAGRRSGKTTGTSILAVEEFLDGGRVLYATPTQEQVDRFWTECKLALREPLDEGWLYKNESRHIIELSGTEQRIRAKTAWNADTLRGDYAGLLILDEYQLMKPDAWGLVGAPMLLDNDGDAVFIYTSKRGARHAQELYKRAEEDKTGRWAVFRFTSHDNPHLSKVALNEITGDMTDEAYRMEILAEDIIDNPHALWKRQEMIEGYRVTKHPPLTRIVVGVDPSGSSKGDECGIVTGGLGIDGHGYILADDSLQASPAKWGAEVVTAYHRHEADLVVGETNYGGEMVEQTIRTASDGAMVAYKAVHASRGKQVRAEPIAALYGREMTQHGGMVHHVGTFTQLEDEMCSWMPGDKSPNRLDALVWTLVELMLGRKGSPLLGFI